MLRSSELLLAFSLVILVIAEPNRCVPTNASSSEATVFYTSCQDADFSHDQLQESSRTCKMHTSALGGCGGECLSQIIQDMSSLRNESILHTTAQEHELVNRNVDAGGGISVFGGAALCFSGDVSVETREGPKRMSELKMGDEVMCVDGMVSFAPIVMFLHRDEQLLAPFNVITTTSGDSVTLTDEHFIYTTDCKSNVDKLIKAKDVTTEHCLIVVATSSDRSLTIERVVSVSKTYEVGVYAPLTSTGNIVVNNVLSSCHSNLAVQTLQHWFFSLYRTIASFLPKQDGLPFGIEYLASSLDLFVPVAKVVG